MFVKEEICANCGGRCCKKMPGACFPADFDISNGFAKLDSALESGRYCIDWWEGDPREGKNEYPCGYFIRPATKGEEGRRYDPSWGGECTFLGEEGCTLGEDSRPLGCQMLEPKLKEACVAHEGSSKQKAAIAWLPFYNRLKH